PARAGDVPGDDRPRQARRELHAARGRRRAEALGALDSRGDRGRTAAMIVELGHYALVLALFLALVQSTVPLYGAARGDAPLMALADTMAIGQFVFVLAAFLALMNAYVTSDFSVANVVQNSHTAKPLLYKISGVWGNHEGSM